MLAKLTATYNYKNMIILELIIILVIFGCIYLGYKAGFLEAFGSILGLIIAAAVAWRTYDLFTYNNVSKIFFFVLVFLLVGKIIGYFFFLIAKYFDVLETAPVVRTVNRILGATIGAIEGILIAGFLLYIISSFSVSPWIKNEINHSFVAQQVINLSEHISQLMPKPLQFQI